MTRPARGADLGRYIVLHEIGQGGLGVVLAAYDPQLDRRVAIKLMHARGRASSGTDDAEARVLREARALARVVHPNIVAIHDAGLHGGELFIVMEMVDGFTLREWLDARPRSLAQIVETFLQAGRGLEAAHAAGLVHRDFKPQNVLVGNDGRVRVADFGLARILDAREAPPRAGASRSPDGDLDGDSMLTVTGALLGTPLYMAPEQHRGSVVDARADQFAFCVALHEALYGQRPFSGRTYEELAAAVRTGRLVEPPSDRKVPGRLRAAVLRGLEVDPAARHASMAALLAALAPPRRWRLRVAAAAGGLLLAMSAAAWVARRAELCAGAPRELAAVWGQPARERLQAAFVATHMPFAADAFERVARVFDEHGAAWARMRGEACRATHDGTQSSQALDLRMRCLDRRLGQLGALVEVLSTRLDGTALEQAVLGASELAPVADCADLPMLAQAFPPPRDAPTRARVEALRARLGLAEAQHLTGHYPEALALSGPIVAEARATGHLPLLAEALAEHGRMLASAGQVAAAEVAYRETLRLAAATGNDDLLADATVRFAEMVGSGRARADEAMAMAPLVQAALARVGDPDALVAVWETAQGAILRVMGKVSEALPHIERAATLFERRYGAMHPVVAQSLSNLGTLYQELYRFDEALEMRLRARAMFEAALGAEHPQVARALMDLATLYYRVGRDAEAMQMAERAMAMRQKVLGPEHIDIAKSLSFLSVVELRRGDAAQARDHLERALAITEKALGPEHPEVAKLENRLGSAARLDGRFDDAERHYQRSLAIVEKALGGEHWRVAEVLGNLANLAHTRGDYEKALRLHERALAITLKARGPDHGEMADELNNTAETLRALGRLDEARADLERALAIREKLSLSGPDNLDVTYPLVGLAGVALEQNRLADAETFGERALRIRKASPRTAPVLIAECDLVLGRVSWARGADRAGSLARVRAAQVVLAADPASAATAAEAAAWLRAHGH